MSLSFLPTSSRILVIIQLCLAFGIIAWRLIFPLGMNHIHDENRLRLVNHVIGNKEFSSVSVSLQKSVYSFKDELKNQKGLSFWQKTKQSTSSLFFETDPFLQAWCYLTLLSGFLLLFRIEGAMLAQFSSFILAICFLFFGSPHPVYDPLLPQENTLVEDYLGHPLPKSWAAQRKDLATAWDHYLVAVWAKETPSQDNEQLQAQAEKGFFYFSLERVKRLMIDPSYVKVLSPVFFPQSILAVVFTLWNGVACFFIWIRNQRLVANT